MADVITIDGDDKDSLLIFALPDGEVIEVNELCQFLGYSEPSRLARQIKTGWTKEFDVHKDLRFVDDRRWREKYEQQYERVRQARPFWGSGGEARMFLTPSGVEKVLDRSTKERCSPLKAALKEKGFFGVEKKEIQDSSSSPAGAARAEDPVVLPGSSQQIERAQSLLEARERNYEVLQTLIKQLSELKDAALRLLAIEAAEIVLSRQFPDLRAQYGPEGSSQDPSSKARRSHYDLVTPATEPASVEPRLSTAGPLFREAGWYNLKRIGDMAGGYSAVAAGHAANIIAAKRGFTSFMIRNQATPFSRVVSVPDNRTGKKHPMAKFNTSFSNAVVQELRSNPKFKPIQKTSALTAFNQGRGIHPNLSQGVVLDDEVSSDHEPAST